MANLLTKKIMDNIARQYDEKNDHRNNVNHLTQRETDLLKNLMKGNMEVTKIKNISGRKKITLQELAQSYNKNQ